jgi:hypothetical protein
MLSKIQMWRILPNDEKMELKRQFRIRPSGSREIVDNQIIDDGVRSADLETINEEILCDKLGIKPQKNEKTKKKTTEQTDETSVQRGNSGGGFSDQLKGGKSVPERESNKQSGGGQSESGS